MIFTSKQIDELWEKATPDRLRDPREYRKDFAGAWIRRDRFGYQAPFGWTASRIRPLIKGGSNDMDNLIPCHWRNKRMKGADYPEFRTIITSLGTRNVAHMKSWKVE